MDTSATISKVSLVGLGATTHAFNHNQSYIELDFSPVTGGISVSGPQNSTEATSGFYMLFIHDDQGVPSKSVMIRIDVPGVDVRVPGGPAATVVDESGTTSDFTVALSAPPSSPVVLNIGSTDPGEATAANSTGGSTLTFDAGNWATPQTVTVTGVDDTIFDGTQKSSIRLWVDDAASDDLYDNMADFLVSVSTTNDESLNVAPGDTFVSRLNPEKSGFGDDFVNFEQALGEAPPAPNTAITGWFDITFSEVTDGLSDYLEDDLGQPLPDDANLVQFRVDFFGAGTDPHIEWGSGAQYRILREKTYTNGTNQEPWANAGVLDVNSGEVLFSNIDGIITNTTAQNTNRLNRFPAPFGHTYPNAPADPQTQQILSVLQPRLVTLTDPDEINDYLESVRRGDPVPDDVRYLFAMGKFHWDSAGDITNFEFHGETMTPSFAVGLLPAGDPPFGFPPPFSNGPFGEFNFPNPTSYWKEPSAEFEAGLNSNGVTPSSRLPYAVYLHPHIDILTEELHKVEDGAELLRPSASLPEAIGGNLAVAAEGDLFSIGGVEQDGTINGDFYRYQFDQNAWSLVAASGTAPAVSYSAGANIDGAIYVAGGNTADGVSGDVWVYDISGNAWNAVASMAVPVHSAAHFTDGQRLYVLGGIRSDGTLSDATQIYDAASDSWSFGANLPRRGFSGTNGGSQGRAAAGVVFDGSTAYLVGGTTSEESLEGTTDVFTYAPRGD